MPHPIPHQTQHPRTHTQQHPVRLEKLPDPPLLSVAPSLQGSTMIASAQGLYVDVWQWDTHDDQVC